MILHRFISLFALFSSIVGKDTRASSFPVKDPGAVTTEAMLEMMMLSHWSAAAGYSVIWRTSASAEEGIAGIW